MKVHQNAELSVSRLNIDDIDGGDSARNEPKTLKEIFFEKLFVVKTQNYRFMLMAKFLKRKLTLRKSPKHKGYGKFLNIEEKRY